MKTNDLVKLLATGVGSVDRHVIARRYTVALSVGVIAATLLMLGMLGVRADLAEAVRLPMFWVKLGFVASLAVASLLAVQRLSQPGQQLNGVRYALVTPLLIMFLLAAIVLINADPSQRLALLLGSTWTQCPLLIALLSGPAFIAILWAMQGLAPTRLRLAGTAAGLLAGAIGALVYCLHCPEMEAPFIASWYLLGMLIPAATGTLLGCRVLRW